MGQKRQELTLNGVVVVNRAPSCERKGTDRKADVHDMEPSVASEDDEAESEQERFASVGVALVHARLDAAGWSEAGDLASKTFRKDERLDDTQCLVGRHPDHVGVTAKTDKVTGRKELNKLPDATQKGRQKSHADEPS